MEVWRRMCKYSVHIHFNNFQKMNGFLESVQINYLACQRNYFCANFMFDLFANFCTTIVRYARYVFDEIIFLCLMIFGFRIKQYLAKVMLAFFLPSVCFGPPPPEKTALFIGGGGNFPPKWVQTDR